MRPFKAAQRDAGFGSHLGAGFGCVTAIKVGHELPPPRGWAPLGCGWVREEALAVAHRGAHHQRGSPSEGLTIRGAHHQRGSPSEGLTIRGTHHQRRSPLP